MDASWVAAIASVASAFVVGVAAIAAFLQIRHVRNANDIAIYLHLLDRLDSVRATAVFGSIEEFTTQLKTNSTLRHNLAQPGPVAEFDEIERLIRFLDNLTMLMHTRSVTERLFLTKYADEIVQLWNQLAESIYLRRSALGPHFAAMYENLAMRAKARIESGEIDRIYGRLSRDPRMLDFVKNEEARREHDG